MRKTLYRVLPVSLRERLLASDLYNTFTASRFASTSKRVDVCAAQLASVLHLANHKPIAGKTCLEIGSGFVLSHAVICYLLGAKSVIATDVVRHAVPKTLSTALRKSIPYLPRDLLAHFDDHSAIRERYNRLLKCKTFNFDNLKDFGIEYIAPIDLAKERLNTPIDFVFSNSVLEHVPQVDIYNLINNLSQDLSPGGTMIHNIHLEDHKNISGGPFDFFTISREHYSKIDEGRRGNRLRKSKWEIIFREIANTESKFIYSWQRKDVEVPQDIDESIQHTDMDDLITSHISILTRKMGASNTDAITTII